MLPSVTDPYYETTGIVTMKPLRLNTRQLSLLQTISPAAVPLHFIAQRMSPPVSKSPLVVSSIALAGRQKSQSLAIAPNGFGPCDALAGDTIFMRPEADADLQINQRLTRDYDDTSTGKTFSKELSRAVTTRGLGDVSLKN